jgi:hypothetical protein
MMKSKQAISAPPSYLCTLMCRDREQAMTMHASFQRLPVGDAAEKFYNHLETYDNAYRTSERYGKSIAILQSSGTGKSKLMRDISHWVCVTEASPHQYLDDFCYRHLQSPYAYGTQPITLQLAAGLRAINPSLNFFSTTQANQLRCVMYPAVIS